MDCDQEGDEELGGGLCRGENGTGWHGDGNKGVCMRTNREKKPLIICSTWTDKY